MKRNKFSLSNTRLFTCNMGQLVPAFCTEILPGDSFQQATSLLLRCIPLGAPVMHPVRVRIHHWYVPYRLLWEEWEDFITGGPDGNNSSAVPTIHMPDGTGFAVGSLADLFGLPTGVDGTGGELDVNAFLFRAYAKIWNECYRDQDLQTELPISYGSGLDTITSTSLQNCAWEKDYYTSARPWEQKGPSVTIPLGTRADVKGIGNPAAAGAVNYTVGTSASVKQTGGDTTYSPSYRIITGTDLYLKGATAAANSRPDIYADLTGASAVTVNLLREALALQRYEEARARYGSRYVEYLRYLGVRSSDARLQRPEYLGGGVQTIQFSEVLQTAEGTDPVGEMRGHGIAAMRSNRYRRFFEEHGCLLTLVSVQPKTIYMDGIRRMWSRRSKDEFWQQEFEHIGQQPVLNKEVYADHTDPLETFGYQDRYDEYRREESLVAGEFKTSLDYWHFGRQFGSDPALNADFVKCVPTETPFATDTTDTLLIQAKHSIQARRMLSQRGNSFIF